MMDPQKKLDTIFETVQISVQDELTSLLGVEILLADAGKGLATKSEVFNRFAGNQICTRIDIGRDVEGSGGLFLNVNDAIMLAGTLIMLPGSELDEIIGREEYSEETENSYGEITNLICSSMTRDFGEMYPKSCRFIRKEEGKIVPLKVDLESDEPVKNEMFYRVSFSMILSGTAMGEMVILLPAASFNIQLGSELMLDPLDSDPVYESASESEIITEQRLDIMRPEKRVEVIFSNCQRKMSDEISELLGTDFQLIHLDNKIIGGKHFFAEEVSDKQIVAEIETAGEIEEKSYISISMKDAIWIGGKLIMIPDSELQMYADEEDFNLDMEDAYSEVLNIFSTILTTVFEEEYTKKIRFIKTGIKPVVPVNVESLGDEPIPEQDYCVSSMKLILGDNDLGSIHMLFPVSMMRLGGLGETVDGNEPGSSVAGVRDAQRENVYGSVAGDADDLEGVVDILLIGDDADEVRKLRDVLRTRGYVVRVLSFKDNVNDYLSRELKAIYLVTRDVDEQAFGVVIKVSSVCSLPLIAAAPGWTKTKVIKAVKYGVRDILLTPANTEDIEENIANNLARLAA